MLVDLNQTKSSTRENREMIAAQLNQLATQFGHLVLGVAYVTDNWLSRAALTVVLSDSKALFPQKTFRKRGGAMEWLEELAAESSSTFAEFC